MGDPKINRVSASPTFHVVPSSTKEVKDRALEKVCEEAVGPITEKIIRLHNEGLPVETIVASVSAEFNQVVDDVEAQFG